MEEGEKYSRRVYACPGVRNSDFSTTGYMEEGKEIEKFSISNFQTREGR
jgi:hypothetical protein